MDITYGTALIVLALASSLYLLTQRADRVFPMVATVAAGIEALMAFGIMSVTLTKFRIDVILPALLVVAGVVSWGKLSTKGGVTAATLVAVIGAMQLLLALRLLS